QLIEPRTAAELRNELFQALQGIGFVRHRGTGTGALVASGVAAGSYDVVVRIVATGELGTATLQHSLDGGKNWSSTLTVPSGGTYALGSTGATLRFVPGPPSS